MINRLLLAVAVSLVCIALPVSESAQQKTFVQSNARLSSSDSLNRYLCYVDPFVAYAMQKNICPIQDNPFINQLMAISIANKPFDVDALKKMLETQGDSLNIAVINKVLSTMKYVADNHIDHNNILTIIDYSLPSSDKRLWIFDLNNKKLLFHTYVSHGIKSGELLTDNFSNKNNSRATSMGVYATEKAYYGRDGISLRLDGLDRGFNDNASGRSIVMHGGWYVEENFIKKYGRAGRSWGCPAVPLDMAKPIINTIKDRSILVAYYPNDNWFNKSKFLQYDKQTPAVTANTTPNTSETRDDVLFADAKNNKQIDTRAVIAMNADTYEQIFHYKAPLGRMLRRQINHTEYVALSNEEFKTIVDHHHQATEPDPNDGFYSINLVLPTIKNNRGYFETVMNIVDTGKVKEVVLNGTDTQNNGYTIHFDKRAGVNLRPISQFVRWIGL